MFVLLVALLACTGKPTGPGPNPPPSNTTTTTATTPTTSTTTTTTSTTSTTSTTTPWTTTPWTPSAPLTLCEAYQDVSSGALNDGWVAPDGTLYAVGDALPRVRDPAGTWMADPASDVAWAWTIDGVDDEIWALAADPHERDPTGTWTAHPIPVAYRDTVALAVRGPDDVVALQTDFGSLYSPGCTAPYMSSCPSLEIPILMEWDGAAWIETQYPAVAGHLYDMALLPDGRPLVAHEGLTILDATPISVPVPATYLYVHDLFVAPDGTIVMAAGDHVALGDTSGLALEDPPFANSYWQDAWGTGATDLWVSGWGATGASIAHWDGLNWTLVMDNEPGGPWALAGDGLGTVFALGADDREVALIGDTAGFTVDREQFDPGALNEIAPDDVTGEAWGIGWGAVLGHYTNGIWSGVPLPLGSPEPDELAASDGRVVLIKHHDDLMVWENDVLDVLPTPDIYFSEVTAADGVLFAAGDGENAGDPPTVWRNDGAGWVPMDTTALPADANVFSAWAVGADELWLGLRLANFDGAIAHWNGTAWTIRVTGLDDAPSWLAEMIDTKLYFSQFVQPNPAEIWVLDATGTYGPAPGLPLGSRWAHLLPDGSWFVSAQLEPPGGPDYSAVLYGDPTGTFTELLTDNYLFTLEGLGDTVWTAYYEQSWTYAPCP